MGENSSWKKMKMKNKIVDGSGLKIGIVVSEYNVSIGMDLLRGAEEALAMCNIFMESIRTVNVPGAFEIPLAVKRLAENEETFHAIIALGCVIRGETSHYDLICNEVTRALMKISLDSNIPVLNGILTTENLDQASARSKVYRVDEVSDWDWMMNNKGYECALSALQMCKTSS